MKILVMNLLRIGDIVLSAPALRSLREKYPAAQIDLLINSQFRGVAALLPYIDHVHCFDRDKIQKGLGDGGVPVFESYERLSLLIDQLNGESYDIAINLTHNGLSGWMMSLIHAKKHIGLSFDQSGRGAFGSPWLKYLNSQVDEDGASVFHFSDIFRSSVGGDVDMSHQALVETKIGTDEVNEFLERQNLQSSKIVVVQALTSDPKKDWGLSRFESALSQFARVNPQADIVVLGAPFERERVEPLVRSLEKKGVKAHLAILSFEGAFSLLKRSHLLLSGDTSIKHLACAAQTQIVELSLGSSDLYRTGAYRDGSIIIQTQETCAPCSHSKACHRESHFCSARIAPDAVAMVMSEAFNRRTFQLESVAAEYGSDIEIFKVDNKTAGFWACYSLREPLSEESAARWLTLSAKKIWLSAQEGAAAGESIGTEALRLNRLLKKIHPHASEIEWRHLLGDFERQAELLEGRMNGFKASIRHLHGCYENPMQFKLFMNGIIKFKEKIRHMPLLKPFMSSLDQLIEDDISPAFTRFRRVVDTLSEVERRNAIQLRIVRQLNSHIEQQTEMEGP